MSVLYVAVSVFTARYKQKYEWLTPAIPWGRGTRCAMTADLNFRRLAHHHRYSGGRIFENYLGSPRWRHDLRRQRWAS